MSQHQQSGKSFRSFLGIEPSKPTTKDSVFVIIDAVSTLLSAYSVSYFITRKIKNVCTTLYLNSLYSPKTNQKNKTKTRTKM